MGILRQESWSGFFSLSNLSNPGIKPASLTSLARADRFFTTRAIWEAPILLHICSEINHRALIMCQTLTKEIAMSRVDQSSVFLPLGLERRDKNQPANKMNKSILEKTNPLFWSRSVLASPPSSSQWTTTWTVAGCALSVFLNHRYSSPPTFPRYACNLLPFVFPELHFLCYCQINSISGYFKLASVYLFI